MPRFRRRPNIVDAMQFFPGRASVPGVFTKRSDDNDGDLYFVVTIHGDEATVEPGDWIIPEPDGEHHYPVKPDIFARTYEALDRETAAPLTFAELRAANVRRTEEIFHPIDDWSPTDWATAFGGEAGEALNLVKKLRRVGDRHARVDPDVTTLKQLIGNEVADTVIYADLLLARLGLELGRCVVGKFDRKSTEFGSSVRLGDALSASDDILRRRALELEGVLSKADDALDSIRVRCTEGDARSDWLPVIDGIAHGAQREIEKVKTEAPRSL